MPPEWLQLSVRAPALALDAISNFLIERGSPGVVLEKNGVRAFFPRPDDLFPLKRDIQRFLQGIREIYPGIQRLPLRWVVLKDKNWNESWRRFFSPQKVGKAFWVIPSWHAPAFSTNGRKIIWIEPGMAFGTGTHPTTQCCLEFLEEVALSGRSGVSALDVGTGSGILSIALAKLGVVKTLALDNDPLALKVAAVNLKRNRVARMVNLSGEELDRVKNSFGIVVANLSVETITDLYASLRRRVSPRGWLILSGILQPRAKEVLRHFVPRPFCLIQQRNLKGWTTLLLRKKG